MKLAIGCALGLVLGLFVVGQTRDDVTLRLAYAVLYDREFFLIGARELRAGKFPKENVAAVNEMIVEDYDKWLYGELQPLVQEYFKAMPGRCESWRKYPVLTGCK